MYFWELEFYPIPPICTGLLRADPFFWKLLLALMCSLSLPDGCFSPGQLSHQAHDSEHSWIQALLSHVTSRKHHMGKNDSNSRLLIAALRLHRTRLVPCWALLAESSSCISEATSSSVYKTVLTQVAPSLCTPRPLPTPCCIDLNLPRLSRGK